MVKKLILLLLILAGTRAFAQYPAPAGTVPFVSSQFFKKIVGSDTTVYAKDAAGNWYPIGRINGHFIPLTFTNNINVAENGFGLTLNQAGAISGLTVHSTENTDGRATIDYISAKGDTTNFSVGVDPGGTQYKYGIRNKRTGPLDLPLWIDSRDNGLHLPMLGDTSGLTKTLVTDPVTGKIYTQTGGGGSHLVDGSGTTAVGDSTLDLGGVLTHDATIDFNDNGVAFQTYQHSGDFLIRAADSSSSIFNQGNYGSFDINNNSADISVNQDATHLLEIQINTVGNIAVGAHSSFAVFDSMTHNGIEVIGVNHASYVSNSLVNKSYADSVATAGGGITALTGDVTASGTGSVATTLATVNSTPGSYGDATHVATVTTNGKGLVTASGSTAITFPVTASNSVAFTNKTGNISQWTNDSGYITSSASGANPTASVGLTAVNGSAGTFMRSDGSPALSQAIVPTWTGLHTYQITGGGSTARSNIILLNNATAAVNGTQQRSGAIELDGNTFNNSISTITGFRISMDGAQSGSPVGTLHFDRNLNGTYFNDIAALTTNGDWTVNGVGSFGSGLKYTGGTFQTLTYNIYSQSNSLIHSSTAAYLWGGAADVGYRTVFGGNQGGAMVANNNFSNVLFANELAITTASSGTHAYGANVTIAGQTITPSGSGTVTDGAALIVTGPSAGAATNSAILAVSGDVVANNGNISLRTAGNKLKITEGTNGSVGQVALVSGTKAISITGVTTSSRAFVTLVSPGGTTLTTSYQAVCTSGTLTLQANVAAGTINTSDTSTLNYFIIN